MDDDDDSRPQNSESETKVIQLDCLSEDEVLEEHVPQKEEPVIPLRRLMQQKRAPDFYGDRVTIAEEGSDPISYKNALDSVNKDHWIYVMDEEIESLKSR